MSTRSYIIQKKGSGYAGIYCHWDGYPEHNGQILLQHYSDPVELNRLIEGGDLSVLDEVIGNCEFYRDRGDDWECVKPTVEQNVDRLIATAEQSGCEYVYYFDGDSWHYASRGIQCFGLSDGSAFSELRPLAHAFLDSKITALAEHLNIQPEEIQPLHENCFGASESEFLVLTDEEAESAFDQALKAFVDDCILPDIPEHLQSYFDTARWKQDARYDGRGHSLASYDGCEHEAGDFYIYRIA